MLAETRRHMLIDLLSRRGFATLAEMVESLGVSESTIRRDLETLEHSGSVRRTHGGAIGAGDGRTLPAFEERVTASAAEKRAIGRATAALIEDGEAVLLDGGTTTLEVARALLGRPVQVVTNSIPIAQLVASGKETDLILIGGYVYPRTGVALGPLAIAMMQGLRVRKAILGVAGIMPDGIYNSNLLLVETERQMIECGQEVIIVADRSKFGCQSLVRLANLAEIDRVVVDSELPDPYRRLLESSEVRIHEIPIGPEDAPAEVSTNGRALPPSPRTEP